MADEAANEGPHPPLDQEPLPLAGVRVVEVSQMVAGPSAALLLADYGAKVVKVEPPGGDAGRRLKTVAAAGLTSGSPVFLAYNRNKRLVSIDLKDEAGRAEVAGLIANADVFLSASRPGAMERLGLGPDQLLAQHPRLVYAAVSGFGWRGQAQRRGVDLIVQAESGMMSATGFPELPPTKVGFPIVDAACGHAVCHGILAALFRRERTGRGGLVRVSLYDLALHLQASSMVEYLLVGEQLPRAGNSAPLSAPADVFACADGLLAVSAYTPTHWRAFVHTVEATELLVDDRFATQEDRVRNRDQLTRALEAVLQTRPAQDWVDRLGAAGVVAGRVKDYRDVMADSGPDTGGRMFERMDDGFGIRTPVELLDTPDVPFLPPRDAALS